MAMDAIAIETRCDVLERSVVTAHSRDAVTKALYEALLDGLDFGPRDLPRVEDREWLRGAVAMPLQEATDAALHALVWNVAEAIESAPIAVRERFDRSHEGEDLGWE
jgi:hypothetical protein